jgi:hypothetical protein
VLDGPGAQTVSFYTPGATSQRFWDLEIDNSAGVTFISDVYVNQDLVMTSGTVGGTRTTYIGGDLVEVLGGNQYQVQGASFSGDPALPASVQSNVTFTGTKILAANLEVLGNLTVTGSLDIATDTLLVTGNFNTTGSGTLTMATPTAVLGVDGGAAFNGGSTTGLLTDGVIYAGGNVSTDCCVSTSLAPSGNHRFVLDGPGAQTVSFYTPGATSQRFWDLEIDNSAGVTFRRLWAGGSSMREPLRRWPATC